MKEGGHTKDVRQFAGERRRFLPQALACCWLTAYHQHQHLLGKARSEACVRLAPSLAHPLLLQSTRCQNPTRISSPCASSSLGCSTRCQVGGVQSSWCADAELATTAVAVDSGLLPAWMQRAPSACVLEDTAADGARQPAARRTCGTQTTHQLCPTHPPTPHPRPCSRPADSRRSGLRQPRRRWPSSSRHALHVEEQVTQPQPPVQPQPAGCYPQPALGSPHQQPAQLYASGRPWHPPGTWAGSGFLWWPSRRPCAGAGAGP